MEGADEIHGLRFWNGDPTVQLLEADDEQRAMLLERCLPGYMLRSEPEEKQDLVIAALLKRLWRRSTSLNGIHAFVTWFSTSIIAKRAFTRTPEVWSSVLANLRTWIRSDCSFGPLPAPPPIPDQNGAVCYG